MEDIVDIPEQIGSLGAWLPPPACAPSGKVSRAAHAEATAPGSATSQPIPIPSMPRRATPKAQSCDLFEPRFPHLAASSDSDEFLPLPEYPRTFQDSFRGCVAAPISLGLMCDSLTYSLADGNVDTSTAGPCGWAADSCSSDRIGGAPQRRSLERLLDGYQITAGPLGAAASLPFRDTQAPISLAQLCKALSSPAAHMAREVRLANPTPQRGACAFAGWDCKGPISGLSEAFDAVRAIAAFERSTSWTMAPAAANSGTYTETVDRRPAEQPL